MGPVPQVSALLYTLFDKCSGAGRVIGVGNGNPLSHEDDVCADDNWKRLLFNGKAQIVVRAAEAPGRLTVRARLVPTGAVAEIVLDVR